MKKKIQYRNKQGLYDEMLLEPEKEIIDWYRNPLKKVGKLCGVVFMTIRPFPKTTPPNKRT
jgi:hypothetical protein